MVRNNVRIRGKLGNLISLVVIVGLILAQIPPGIVSAQPPVIGNGENPVPSILENISALDVVSRQSAAVSSSAPDQYITGNVGVAGATLSFTDGAGTDSVTADATGAYSIPVSYDWSGTVTPSLNGYVFTPMSRNYPDVYELGSTPQDYIATSTQPLVISGNAGIEFALLSYTDGTLKTVKTDGEGNYSIVVSESWSGTITPFHERYAFDPVSRDYTNVVESLTGEDYTASSIVTYQYITGNVGVGGAALSVTDQDGTTTVTADSSGAYSIRLPNVGYWSGTVAPSLDVYVFTPASRVYPPTLDPDYTEQDYVATSTQPLVISGNAGIEFALLSYTDGTLKTVKTDGGGNYSIVVPENWSGIVTPSKDRFSFEPVSRDYTNVVESLTGEDYTASSIVTYQYITGNVGVGGAALSVTDQDGTTSVTADETGAYSIRLPNVGYWSGTVTPSLDGYVFTPASRVYPPTLDPDYTGQDYVATSTQPLVISGNADVAYARLSYDDVATKTVFADGAGDYSIVVPENWSGSVTPSRNGYSFLPASTSYSEVLTNLSGEDYTVTLDPLAYSISGNVGIAGATLSYTNGEGLANSVLSDVNGAYTVVGLPAGSYTLAPTKMGYTFTPVSQPVTLVDMDISGIDFTPSLAEIFSISGTILDSALAGVPGVMVSAGTVEDITASDGSYTLYGLTLGDHTITPMLAGYGFIPVSRLETISGTNLTAVDFTAEQVYSVSGLVTDGAGAGVEGVEIVIDAEHTTLTDLNGAYTIGNLPAGAYTLIPEKTDEIFTPSSLPVTLGPDATAVNFVQNNKIPIVTGFTPSFTGTGTSTITLTIEGENFVPDSQVLWNGNETTGYYISSTQLTFDALAADISASGQAQVTVINPEPGGGTSDIALFPVISHIPGQDQLLASSKVTFDWDDIPGATTYNIQLSLSSDFSTLVVQTPALSSSFAYSTALVNGKTYYWRIQPVYGTTPGEWSPAWRFYSMNPLPAPAPLLSPPSGSQTNNNTPEDPIVFTWTGVPNADKYNVQISRNYKFTDIVEDVVNASGEPRYTTHSLTENRLYYWRVRAIDAVPVPDAAAIDVPGAWSGYWTFTLDTQTPKAPVYFSPKDNAFTADTTPLLYMYKVTGATRYRFQVAVVDDVEGDDFEVPANIRLDTTVTVNYLTTPVLGYGEYYWRVQALDGAGNVSDWSTARKLTITFQQYPLEGYASRATMWGFSWYGIPGATAYRLEVTEDDGTLPENREDTYAYQSVDLGSLVRKSYLTLGLGNYLWRLRASTAGGDVVSPWRKMTVTTAPLAAPLLLNLTNGKSTNSHIPTLEWTAVPGAVKYELWVDNTLNFSSPEYKAAVDAGTDPQVTHTLGDGSIDFSPEDFIELANGLYYWKVRTINQYDVPGAWSGYFSFTVDDIAPGIPTLLTPANNSFTSDTSPTLSVNSVPGASGYCFQADDSPVFAEPIIVNSICVITGRSVPTRVLDYGEYYWRAKAVDAAGNWSEWTPVYNRFEITFQTSPAPGYVTTEPSPVLSWYAVAGALEYEVELALEADSDFEDPPLIALTEPKTTGLSYTLPNPGPGNYVWRVRASMDGGDPIISSWLPLTITDAPLAPPALESNVSPGNGIYTRSGTPALSWHKVTGGAKYEIWVDNNRYFTNPEYKAVVEAAGSELETHTLGTPAVVNSPEVFTGLPYGVYFWKMRTINQYGVPGAWSSYRYFMVDTLAPKEPVQYSPASNTVTTDTTPTLTVYSVAGASGYCFQADDSPVFDDPIIVNSGCVITGRSVPTHELPYGEYYWRAKAVDVAGNESGWSATRKLYLTYQLKPVDGSAFSDQTPTFTWNAIPGATAYKLEVMAGGIPIASHDLGQVTSYTLVTPLGFGEYTWRLRDNVSNTWTPEYTFYISAVTQDSPGGVYAGSTIYTGPPARARWIERFTVYAPQLRVKERAVSVYLPPDYATSGKSYPVIYLQDGISNYSAISGGSNVDGALEQLFASGEIEGVIAVAVEASGYRWDEYSPWYNYYMRSVWYAWTPNTVEGGEGDAYVHFLVDTLKPVIDARYRTLPDREHTAIGGSSMGGLIALYGAIQYPNVFSKVMALSPAVWFAEAGGYWLQNNRLLKSPFLLSSYFQDGYSFKDVDYFLYIGTSEWSGRRLWLRDSSGRLMSYPRVWLEGANAVYSTLKAKGVPLENLELVTYPGGTHGTGSWRIWEDDAMRWLFAGQTLPAGETPPPLEPGDGSLIAGYEIQFSKSTTFATVLESGEVWDGQLWYEPTSLEDGLHYWRVRSINDLGYRSPWSSAKSIVIDSTGPSVPKHLVPFNGVTLYGYPVFYWLGLADAVAYQFEYAISEDYDPVNGFSAPAFRSGELTKASYQPAFQASGTYYWHVRARDAAGNWGNWSAPFMVTISP